MTTIGFIGSGNIGGTLARLAVDAGYDVVLSNSRGPETLAELAARLGPTARAATATEAAAADLVVLTIPLGRLDGVPAGALAGRVVIDTCNYYPQRDGTIPDLDEAGAATSGYVQRRLPGAHVVKAFNNIFFRHLAGLARPAGAPDRSTLLIAGDDVAAKRAVADFVTAIGYDVCDSGPLADSWRCQRDQPAYAGAYAEGGDFDRPRRATRADLDALLERADPALH